MRLPKLGSAVRIEWLDAHGGASSWQSMEDVKPSLQPVVSIGYLVAYNDVAVAIASDRDADGSYNGVGCVPRALIERVTKLD